MAGKQVDFILLDFSGAFDKVGHTGLLFGLSQHGVGGALGWIGAFLVGPVRAVVPVASGVTLGLSSSCSI